MVRNRILVFSTLAIAAAVAAPAQNRNRIHPDDRNRDGSITESEWRGGYRSFRQHDVNRDGVLSGTEIPESMEATRGPRAGQLDKDHSGVVEGYEWPYNADIFRQLDTDRDSVLSREELSRMNSATRRQLDRNNDRNIDTDEWPGGFAEYDRLDENRDGRVSQDEYYKRGGEFQRRQRFDKWDVNRDGVIQSTEWKSAPQLFRRLDTNRDSTVSWDEFMADTESYRPPYNWR